MATDSLSTLAETIKREAADGPVTLNAALIESVGITPPEDFDAALKAAYRLSAESEGLELTIDPGKVGAVSNNRFVITDAQLTGGFLGAAQGDTLVRLTFTLPDPEAVLELQIQAVLSNWQFSTFFTSMTGWPFALLKLTANNFIFSTTKTPYSWNNVTVGLLPGQNFAAVLTVPTEFKPIFDLVQGLGIVPPTLVIAGPIALDKADNEKILYPDMDLKAVISSATVTIFFLTAYDPLIGFRIVTRTEPIEEGSETTQEFQTPEYYFGLSLDVALEVPDLNGTGVATLDLCAGLMSGGERYAFTLMARPDSTTLISPATVAATLMGGNTYFQYVPPPLQSMLGIVGFKGLALAGPLKPKSGLSSAAIMLGSASGQELVLFSDPTNGEVFTITSIDMQWTISNPLDAKLRRNLLTFTTTFTLWPEVFKTDDGQPGGLFKVSIDQDFNVNAAFNGSVSMDDLLLAITDGAIGMPDGVAISFSDVTLDLSPTAKTYTFSFVLDAQVDFITWDNKPLIKFEGVTFSLTAKTPTSSGSKAPTTAYRGLIEGLVSVGPIAVNTYVEYDGTATPSVWTLRTSLAEPLDLGSLIRELFNSYTLPDFLPIDLVVETFSIDATIPSKPKKTGALVAADTPAKSTYKVDGSILWNYNGIPNFPIATTATIGLQFDGNLPVGRQFSGSVIGTVLLDAIGVEVMIGYSFGPATVVGAPPQPPGTPPATNTTLWVQWEGIRATYSFTNQTISFTLNGWTVGSLLEALVRMVGDPYFTLDSPWDLLNQIPLDGLALVFDLKPNVTSRVSAKYSLPRPINLGFVTIRGLTFQKVAGQVTIAIDGTTTIPGMSTTPLFNPNGPGQNVQNMPQVPGRGNALFDLRLLAMGQRIGIQGYQSFKTTQEAIKALEGIPPTTGKSNPVNPTATTKGQPYYQPTNNWMVAADFGLIRVLPNVYTFDCMILFNDPNLYGLRLQFNGEKAKVLAGLVIDILYKKITDDIGLYQIEFSFPSILRNLDFGAFSIVLPNIGIQIYTNGDFLFDFGFPYNLNFDRSFTVQAIVYGVPVLGSAGFYFGKLSNATAPRIPKTTKGTFDPVIVFGFGAQIGVGRYFEKGPLKAGFSITVFGIIEGVIAPWHPYDASGAALDAGSVQGSYYFWLQGQFGIIGKLYGTVDFAVIKADVQVLVQLVAKITYESFRAIPLSISAHVSIKVSLKINLGLFSITISFSFAATISADLTIGSNSRAPWDEAAALPAQMRRLQRMAPVPSPAGMLRARPRLRFKSLARLDGDAKPKLTLVPAPQFTVMLPDVTSIDPATQQGAFVFLLAMDAPTAGGTGNQDGSSFESLCELLLPWVIDALKDQVSDMMLLGTALDTTVTKEELDAITQALADNANPPISFDEIITFLSSSFDVDVVPADAGAASAKVRDGATIFPPFPGFSLTIPDPSGADGATVTIDLDDYVDITKSYQDTIAAMFREIAARVEDESGKSKQQVLRAGDDPTIALMRYVFEDYFLLIARQLVGMSSDAMDDYAFELRANDSIVTILSWAQGRGNDHILPQDVAEPNLDHPLTADRPLTIDGLRYTVQRDESTVAVANRYSDTAGSQYTTTPSSLIIANAAISNLIQPNVVVTIVGHDPYTTVPGDSFNSIAAGLGVSLDVLANDTGVQGMTTLLAPSIPMTIPPITFKTVAGDTLNRVLALFTLPLERFLATPANLAVENLFDASSQKTIALAHLDSLLVSDLWSTIKLTDGIAQTAGMAARYPLYGMRLPNVTGLELPTTGFLYPSGQSDYGLYQLTGQEFPTPPLAAGASYGITLAKGASLDWVKFNGAVTTGSMDIGLTEQARQLSVVLEYAIAQGYDPAPTLEVQAATDVQPKRFAIRSATLWSTSDQARLTSLTAPAAMLGAAMQAASDAPQTQPILWALPETMLRQAEERQAILSERLPLAQSLRYLSVYGPKIGSIDPATRMTTYTPAEHYAFATSIEFQVKRLAQADDPAPQNPFGNDVVPPSPSNDGSPAVPLAPFSYELIGPGPADAVLLQRILTAMDSLGEEMVSGLFILYPDNGSAPTGLVSRGDSEFLSFITQTNLSTETNPPAMLRGAMVSEEQPRGIANTPAEFIKLLWELSTVRSGGYYLYYELVNEGTGLPEGIFDDSGVATLSLSILYNRDSEPANGGRLTNYTNSFVTVEPFDMGRSSMTLESESEPATTLPVSATDTPRWISDFYGVALGELVALNGSATLRAGAEIPISGVLHQVTQADVASGDVPARLASIYSKGAKQPLTAAAITAYNPGVPSTLTSVFRIPSLVYVVSTAGDGPGATLPSIADYYGLSSYALGWLVADVPGLFATSATLNTDTIAFDVQPALGVGNVGVKLERADLGTPPDLPANPTPEEKAAFARAYLFSLYTLLTAGIARNPFFNESRPGIAFGPQQDLNDEQAEMLRHPETRRMLLSAAESDPFHYRQALGFGAFSTVNPAPDPAKAGLPPKSLNPYVGVGTAAQMNLAWADIFGNRMVTPFSAPSSSYAGPLNNPPSPIAYVDRLVALDQWPNVRSYYTYGGTAGAPQAEVTFTLNVAAYDAPSGETKSCKNPPESYPWDDLPVWQQSALNDLSVFTQLYFQLSQNYDGLGIPGLAGRAVSMSMTNSILASPEQALSNSDADRLRGFVEDCVVYINNRAHCADGGTAPSLTLTFQVPIASVATGNILPMTMAFTMKRQALLTDPALRSLTDGLSVTTAIQPLTDLPVAVDEAGDAGDVGEQKPPQQDLAVFAAAVEKVFTTDDWGFRVGTGSSDPSAPRSQGAFTVWAVRMGKKKGTGLYYQIGSDVSFYAPQAIAKELTAASAQLNQYKSGEPYPSGDPVDVMFTGVDTNTWANTAFTAIDTFLTPSFTSPAFIVDNLTVSDPQKDGYLAKILRHKEVLAGAVSSTMRPILETSAQDTKSIDAAREKMLQSLLNRLSNAYIVTAVGVIPVTDASTNEPAESGTVAQPRFLGQPLGSTPVMVELDGGTTGEQNYSLSTGKVPLTAAGGDGDTRLAFLFSSKNVKAQRYVSLDLSYAMTHLEHDIKNVPGIENYEQSSWITFVNQTLVTDIGNEPIEFPVLLRELPTPPSVTAQTAASAIPQSVEGARLLEVMGGSPGELATWNYGYSYFYPGSAQDTVTSTVQFNLTDSAKMLGADPTYQLFQALAQFVTVYPAIATDLDAYLRPITGASKPEDVTNAEYALSAFEQITEGVATAYRAWADAQLTLAARMMPSQVIYVFDIDLRDNDGEAVVDIRLGSIEPPDVELPVPVVAIDPALYEVEPVTPPEGVLASYRYKLIAPPEGSGDDDSYLSYIDALAVPDRDVTIGALDLFGLQNAWGAIQVVRNKFLVPGVATTDWFRFSTPQIKFAGPIVPLLQYSEFDLGSVMSGPAPLSAYLDAFFESLLGAAAGQEVEVSMATSFSYRLLPSMTDFPYTTLPVILLPPTSTVVTPGTPPSFVAPFSEGVNMWLKANAPILNATSKLVTELVVFAGLGDQSGQQLPLLTIRGLYIDASNLVVEGANLLRAEDLRMEE